ncbi:Glutathione synthetase [Exaiptasia diaphana]|nr:Glutathione synthetase [Exaiptasia diaphana]
MDLSLHFEIEKLSEKEVKELAKKAAEYAYAKGIIMKSRKLPDLVEHAPFVLYPTPFPRRLFDQAKEVQRDFNVLVHKVSLDHDFLKESLQGTVTVDKFTGRIYDIYEQTRKEGIAQPISLGLLRSDYMLDCENPNDLNKKSSFENMKIKQVEINTIASSFGCLGSKLPDLGSYVLGLHGLNCPVGSPQIPQNTALEGLGEGLAQAWEFYGSQSAVVLMVKSEDESNTFDQKNLEYYLHHRNPSIKMIFHSLTVLSKIASLDNKTLMVFITDEGALKRIRSTFTGLYTLDEGPEGEQTVKMALQDPEKFVLKPQREGGGNNIFGDDIKTTLNQMKTPVDRSQFILMDRIRSPLVKNYIIRPELDKPLLADVLSEFGTFGILISLGKRILVSKEVGHLMRTKSVEHQDGGVASGRANLDSPYLV